MDSDLRIGLPVYFVQPTGPKTVKMLPAVIVELGTVTVANGVNVAAAKLTIFTTNGILSNIDATREEVGLVPGTFRVNPPSPVQAAPAGTLLSGS